ncbi:hypothetical protein B0A50_02562 [Salinomyces thailandicus]|uniref:F-box domain-containing protein n=1 Tax=Salinomyces thailandicus TaxID=706561 RepID=A0A4U0U7X3_9PEZI|nr:hypothetical protein B0A50_02562 [Salinomyces thailandica]
MTSSPLLDLPSEVLGLICDHLEHLDVGHLRLTCHEIAAKLFNTFTTLHFRTFAVNVSPRGLERLDVLESNHSTFANAVQTLSISPVSQKPRLNTSEWRAWSEFWPQGYWSAVEKEFADNDQAVREPFLDAQVLHKLMKTTKRLSAIEIGEQTSYEDLLYGLPHTAVWPITLKGPSGRNVNAVSHALYVVIDLLTRERADDHGLERLQAGVKEGFRRPSDGVNYEVFQHFGLRAGNGLGAVTRLTDLDLSIELPLWWPEFTSDSLSQVLKCLPRLKKLRLELWYSAATKYHCSEMYTHVFNECSLPELEKLHLVKGTCKGSVFCEFLKRHRGKLKDLWLSRMVFWETDWRRDLRPKLEEELQNLDQLYFHLVDVEQGVLRSSGPEQEWRADIYGPTSTRIPLTAF